MKKFNKKEQKQKEKKIGKYERFLMGYLMNADYLGLCIEDKRDIVETLDLLYHYEFELVEQYIEQYIENFKIELDEMNEKIKKRRTK